MQGDEIIRFGWSKTVTTLTAGTYLDASEFASTAARDTSKGYFDTCPHMRGTIESISLWINKITAVTSVDIVILDGASAGTTIGTNDYLDHVSIAAADFSATNDTGKPVVATINDLNIPYWDSANTGKFHIGVLNTMGTSATYNNIRLALTWRPRIT